MMTIYQVRDWRECSTFNPDDVVKECSSEWKARAWINKNYTATDAIKYLTITTRTID